MYRPREVEERLGITSSTRRRWSIAAGDYLSPTAGGAIGENGGSVARRYTDEDVALLAAIQREMAAGRAMDDVLVMLKRGTLPRHVVASDNAESVQRAFMKPSMNASVVPVDGVTMTDLAVITDDWRRVGDDLRRVFADFDAALAANTAAQRDLIAELRIARQPTAPAVKAEEVQPEQLPEPLRQPTVIERIRLLFTGGR